MGHATAASLRAFAESLLAALGAHPVVARDVAWATTEASLDGVDTHGLTLLPRIVKRVDAGRAQMSEPARARDIEAAVDVVDAALTPGQHATMVAVRAAVERAKRHGVGYVSVLQSTHFGACAPFLRALESEGLAGMVGSNSLRSMAAFGLERANLGNNPFGFVIPAEPGPAFLFDASAAGMSFGRRRQLLDAGEALPAEAWVVPQGEVEDLGVCEIADSLDHLAVPFGGYKGASVAVFVELLAGLLAGGHVGAETETLSQGEFRGPGHFVLAFDPVVMGHGAFGAVARRYLDGLHRGGRGVRVPGETAARTRAERQETGIPVAPALRGEFWELSTRTGVELPASLSEAP